MLGCMSGFGGDRQQLDWRYLYSCKGHLRTREQTVAQSEHNNLEYLRVS